MKEQWEETLRRKLENYQIPAPDLLWADIEAAVERKRKADRRKVVVMWSKRVAAAVTLLLIGGAGYLALRTQEQAEVPMMAADRQPVIEHEAPSAGTAPSEPSLVAMTTARAVSRLPEAAPTARHEEETLAENTDLTTTEKNAEPPLEQEPQSVQESQPVPERTETAEHSQRRTSTPVYTPPSRRIVTRSADDGGKLTARVYLSNTLASASGDAFSPGSGLDYQSAMYAAVKNGMYSDGLELANLPNSAQNSYALNDATALEREVHHRQPVRVGVSARYHLDERWSVEAGVLYSYLSSDITWTYATSSVVTEQRLSYVGIPVSVSYRIWNARHVNVYVSGGGTAEKMVKGKATTNGDSRALFADATTEDVKIRPLQYSVNGGIGAEYQVGKLVSVYAEPGVGYYFDNGSKVPTIYQDKPLNFNLKVGLRFDIK